MRRFTLGTLGTLVLALLAALPAVAAAQHDHDDHGGHGAPRLGTVSFPLLLDRDVTVATAVASSARAVLANPVLMSVWGLIVAAGLVLGMIPAFLGLPIVLPVLGHATWHLYRKLVPG